MTDFDKLFADVDAKRAAEKARAELTAKDAKDAENASINSAMKHVDEKVKPQIEALRTSLSKRSIKLSDKIRPVASHIEVTLQFATDGFDYDTKPFASDKAVLRVQQNGKTSFETSGISRNSSIDDIEADFTVIAEALYENFQKALKTASR